MIRGRERGLGERLARAASRQACGKVIFLVGLLDDGGDDKGRGMVTGECFVRVIKSSD